MATAVSPYAPLGRSPSVLVKGGLSSSGRTVHRSSSMSVASTGQFAILLLVLKYWNADAMLHVRERFLRSALESRLVKSIVRSSVELDVKSKISSVLLPLVLLVSRTCHRLRMEDFARAVRGVFVRRPPIGRPHSSEIQVEASSETVIYKTVGKSGVERRNGYNSNHIRSNLQKIDSVLKYWFASGSPNESQKRLWMIANSSKARQEEVDSEIDKKYGSALMDLLDDQQDLTPIAISSRGRMWCEWCHEEDLYGWKGKLAAIVVLDQMSRHIRRIREKTGRAVPDQPSFDELALETSRLFRERHESEIRCGIVPAPMLIFATMPFRHASTISSVGLVQQSVEAMANMEKEIEDMIRRFRAATNRRLAILQDEARREGRSSDPNGICATQSVAKDVKKVISNDDILECQPFEADMSHAEEHPVVRAVIDFLGKVGIVPCFPPGVKASKRKNRRSKGLNQTSQQGKPQKTRHIIVSLSGGVDSMVLAHILSFLRSDENRGFAHLNVVSVHVDYGNRPESAAEATFVSKYSEDTLKVPCTVRRINEVTRGITARDEYEKKARAIRYDLYRAATSSCLETSSDSDCSEGEVGVVLGHHRGDIRENVLSNSHKGCGPLDLSGMTSVSHNDGVVIYRPLLQLEKDEVFSYAHMFGVPYFKDTTPHWSTRGKLRNKLLPLLEEIYGEGSMNNLTHLAQESDEARELVNEAILEPILNSVVRYRMGLSFETAAWKKRGLYFWKLAVRDILHGAGRGMFSDKAIISFLERVQAEKVKEGWLQCRADYATFLRKDGTVFVFHPASLPFREKDRYNLSGLVLRCGEHVTVGPWTISASLVEKTGDDWRAIETRKAIESLESFMTGSITYCIRVPFYDSTGTGELRICPLEFPQNFTKRNRPAAWKSSDLKLESTLPLPCVNMSFLGAEAEDLTDMGYGKKWVLVRITLVIEGSKRIPTAGK